MSRVCPCCATLCLVALALITSACSTSSLPISVALSPSSSQTIDQGQTVAVTATVTNDVSSEGVSWALTGPGSLSQSDHDLGHLQSPDGHNHQRTTGHSHGNVRSKPDQESFAANFREPQPADSVSDAAEWIGGRGL